MTLSSDPVVEESVNPISCTTPNPDSKSSNPNTPLIEDSEDVVEILKLKKTRFLYLELMTRLMTLIRSYQ